MLSFDDQKQIELRSDEVQEILGNPPGWLVRWGTTVVLIGFVTLLVVSWMVRYPDVIAAKIILTTSNPPVSLEARTDAPISRLLVAENEQVKAGDALVVLGSTARFEDVWSLDDMVDQWRNVKIDSLVNIYPPEDLSLGSIQDSYSAFMQKLETYRFESGDKSSAVSNNVSSINQQIGRLRQSISSERKSKARAERQVENAKAAYKRQEDLFNQGLISRNALERERQLVTNAELQRDNIERSILQKESQIINLQSGISNLGTNEREDANSLKLQLRESLSNLRSSIDSWKSTYVLIAPVSGTIAMNTSYYREQQNVSAGDQVLTVVPPSDQKYVGRLSLPIEGSGKVKKGQRVVVKLDSYPFHEFGSVEGTVEAKSIVPDDEQYRILVVFPEELRTNYGKAIPFEQRLQGGAEIITEDKRFLERILEQIFAFGR